MGVISLLAILDIVGAPVNWALQTGLLPITFGDWDLTGWFKLLPGWFTNASLLDAVLALLLVVAAISLLKRRPSSRPLYLLWAVAALAWRATVIIVMAQALPSARGIEEESTRLVSTMGLGAGMIVSGIYCVLPAFSLIWFLRKKIANEVAQWHPISR